MKARTIYFTSFYFILFKYAFRETKPISRRIKGWYVNDELERKRSWPNLRYCPDIRLKGLRKTTKKLIQDSRSPNRDLNPGPPKYERGEITSQPRRKQEKAQIFFNLLSLRLTHCWWKHVWHCTEYLRKIWNNSSIIWLMIFFERGGVIQIPRYVIQCLSDLGKVWDKQSFTVTFSFFSGTVRKY
jgi:hypothetical protein